MTGIVLRSERRRLITTLPAAFGVLVVVSLLSSVSTSSLCAQDDASALLKQGLAKFEEGALDEAISFFEKAFAADPSDDQVGQFVEDSMHAKIYRMVRSDDPRISGIGREILRMSSRATFAAGDDVEAVKTAVQAVMEGSPNDEDVIRKKVFYAANLGRNIVPHLIPYLGDGELDLRAQAMTWISMVGIDALPPLVAACKHPNGRVRTNVALLLGGRRLRHAYSIGYLRAMYETDELKEVKDEANRSFEAILADLNGAAGSTEAAKVYFLRTATHFYLNPYRNPFDIRKYSPTAYSLDDENVVGTRILPFQVSEVMAKQCITEALLLDPNYDAARVLNVCNDAARAVEYDTNAQWYATQDGHEDIKALIVEQKPYVDLVLRNRILSAPSPILYAAIQQAASDGRAAVATTLVRAAHTIGLRGDVPEALVQSLEDEGSRLVRVAAAVTLAYWNPSSGFDAGQQVVDVLANAVETTGVRTVVKGMGNQRVANRFDSLFRTRLNMESLLHDTNVEELLHTLRRSPPDVVFLDEEIGFASVKRATAPINVIVNELRKDYRTSNVPVIVVVDPARVNAAKDAYENAERKVTVVAANIDAVALNETVLRPLFEAKEDGKALATELSGEAARALEYLSSVNTSMPVSSVIESLGRVLNDRPESVRIPCLGALGHLRARSLLGAIAHVSGDTVNKPAIREAAMVAVGRILASGDVASADVLAIISKGCQESDPAIRKASWIAFGRAGASTDAHLSLLEGAVPGAGAADEPETAGDDDDDDTSDDDDDTSDDDDDTSDDDDDTSDDDF